MKNLFKGFDQLTPDEKLKDKTIVRKVIGQNQNQLITFENELIPISDILDINFVK